jgi:hypothetical protein
MIRDCEMLNTIRKTVQMGQVGIEAVLPSAEDPRFSAALRQQLAEYHQISKDADSLLKTIGGTPKDISSMVTVCAKASGRMRAKYAGNTSGIAEMMIEGNTKGMIKSIQNRNQYQCRDQRVDQLSQKLLDTEVHNIEQMKAYL